jgi:valyl-tRNA synthetase
MPFISEEVWHSIASRDGGIIVSPWPVMRQDAVDPEAEARMKLLQDSIDAIRNIRGEMNIPPGKRVKVVFKVVDEAVAGLLDASKRYIATLARTDEITIASSPAIPKPAARAFLPGIEIHMPLTGLIDLGKEQERLQKGLAQVEGEITALDKKLGNEQFLSKAPEHVVAQARGKKEDLVQKREKLKHSLGQLDES